MRTNRLLRAKLCPLCSRTAQPGKAGSGMHRLRELHTGGSGWLQASQAPGLRLLAPMSLCGALLLTHSLITLGAAGVGQELFWTLRKQRWKRYNLDTYRCDPRLQCKMPNPPPQVEKRCSRNTEKERGCVEINDGFRSVKVEKSAPWSQPGRINRNMSLLSRGVMISCCIYNSIYFLWLCEIPMCVCILHLSTHSSFDEQRNPSCFLTIVDSAASCQDSGSFR